MITDSDLNLDLLGVGQPNQGLKITDPKNRMV